MSAARPFNLAKFARDLGSTKGTDPIPPDQYLTYQDRRYPPATRLWAWMLAHTIREGRRSVYAIDEYGKEVSLPDAEKDLAIDHGNLGRAWRQLESEGRVKREARRLRLSGKVELPAVSAQVFAEEETPDDPEVDQEEETGAKINRSGVCTDTCKFFPPYIQNQLKHLPPRVLRLTIAKHAKIVKAEQKCEAEAMAAIRGMFQPLKDSTLTAAGVKLIRQQKTPETPKNGAATPTQLRLIFASALEPFVNGFVQTGSVRTFFESVETHNPSSYKPENGSVQSDPSLYTEQRNTTENSIAAAASLSQARPPRLDAAAAAKKIRERDPQRKEIHLQRAELFCAKCRDYAPECTTEDVLEIIGRVEVGGKVRSAIAIMLSEVPAMVADYIAGGRRPLAERATAAGASDPYDEDSLLQRLHRDIEARKGPPHG